MINAGALVSQIGAQIAPHPRANEPRGWLGLIVLLIVLAIAGMMAWNIFEPIFK
jgi:hypothetical protein